MSDFSEQNDNSYYQNESSDVSHADDFFNTWGRSDSSLLNESPKLSPFDTLSSADFQTNRPMYHDTHANLGQMYPSLGEQSRLPIHNMPNPNAYDWVEQAFSDRKDRLGNTGFQNAREYMQFLASVDDALEKNPKQVIKELCETYGVNMPYTMDFKYPQKVAAYQSERDETGRYKHPYFNAVRPVMADLVQKGVADEIDDAYQKAIWLDERVRKQMLDTHTNTVLNRKAATAQKAREASFSPHSKSSVDGKSEKTFRQELEELFNSMN